MKPSGCVVFAAWFLVLAVQASAQAPPQTLDAAMATIQPSQQLILHQADGRKVSARFVSTQGDEMEFRVLRSFRRDPLKRFSQSSIARVDVVDSNINGVLIGALIGTFASIVVGSATTTCTPCAEAPPMWVALFPAAGIGTGAYLDARNNRTIYERSVPPSNVSAMARWPRRGAAIRISF